MIDVYFIDGPLKGEWRSLDANWVWSAYDKCYVMQQREPFVCAKHKGWEGEGDEAHQIIEETTYKYNRMLNTETNKYFAHAYVDET